MTAPTAVLLAHLLRVAEFLGPFLFGVIVAKTIGNGIVDSGTLTLTVISSALVGAVFVGAGLDAIKFGGLNNVIIALIVSPMIGFLLGFMVTHVIYFSVRGATPGVNEFFKRSQLITIPARAALSAGVYWAIRSLMR